MVASPFFIKNLVEIYSRQSKHQSMDKVYEKPEERQELISLLPFAVEARIATSQQEMMGHLEETLTMGRSDLCSTSCVLVSHSSRYDCRKRFRLEPMFAQVLVEADLVCGVGACLSCIVPLASGASHVRAFMVQ